MELYRIMSIDKHRTHLLLVASERRQLIHQLGIQFLWDHGRSRLVLWGRRQLYSNTGITKKA